MNLVQTRPFIGNAVFAPHDGLSSGGSTPTAGEVAQAVSVSAHDQTPAPHLLLRLQMRAMHYSAHASYFLCAIFQ